VILLKYGRNNGKKPHPIGELDAKMNPAVLEKARRMAREEIFNSGLRIGKKYDMKQIEKAAYYKELYSQSQ
jgi:hypothetical protein